MGVISGIASTALKFVYGETKRWVFKDAVGNEVFMNATVEFNDSYDSEITEHPVERGSNLADHVILINPSGSMQAILSDEDISLFTVAADLTGITKRVKVKERWEQMKAWRQSREVLTLTGPETFENVMIKRFAETKRIDVGGTAKAIEIDFQVVDIIDSAVLAGTVTQGVTELESDTVTQESIDAAS